MEDARPTARIFIKGLKRFDRCHLYTRVFDNVVEKNFVEIFQHLNKYISSASVEEIDINKYLIIYDSQF